MTRNVGLDTLLDLDGDIVAQEGGYWVKFEVHRVKPSTHIPHGIAYSLTLHDNHNQRIMGFDNAHTPKGGRKKRYQGQVIEYDHHHQDKHCKGVPYVFDSPAQLIEDFWKAVDNTLRRHGVIK
jgi:hypothetical protein